jgi:outer membrane lipoprotein-sorting protein
MRASPRRLFSRRFFLALATAFAVSVAASGMSVAAAPHAAQLSPQDQTDLQRVQQYLNGIRTLTARFQQFSQGGGTAEGTLYLARPGHMRFEYDPPNPVLLLANGTWVIYFDKQLQQTTYLPIGSTPAWFLLRNNIALGGDVTVTRFERGPGVIRVSLVETNEPGNGTVTLTFSDHPLELKQWAVTDPQGKVTTVALYDERVGNPIDPNLFVFNDPSQRPHLNER